MNRKLDSWIILLTRAN